MRSFLVRRKILRLPTNPSPIFMHYNILMINAFLPRETQDFASLLCARGDPTWTGEYTSDIAFLPHYRLLNPIAHCRCHVVKRFLLMLSVISYIKAPTDLSDGSGWCGWNITVCRRMEKEMRSRVSPNMTPHKIINLTKLIIHVSSQTHIYIECLPLYGRKVNTSAWIYTIRILHMMILSWWLMSNVFLNCSVSFTHIIITTKVQEILKI